MTLVFLLVANLVTAQVETTPGSDGPHSIDNPTFPPVNQNFGAPVSTRAPTTIKATNNPPVPNLASEIKRQLDQDTTLSAVASQISVVERGQSVQLRGFVQSEAQRVEAERIARDLAPASVRIANQIQIQNEIE